MTSAPLPATRVVLGRAAAVQRTGLAPVLALRPAAGIAIALGVGVLSGHPVAGATMAAGALPVGVATLVGRFRAPLLMLAITCLAMGASTFVGAVSSQVVWAHVALVGVWGFAAGMSVALGLVPSVVAIQAVVAFIVMGRFPQGPGQAAQTALLVAAGGAIQLLLAASVRSSGRFRGERRATGQAYRLLGVLATLGDASGRSLAAAEATAEAEATVARSWAAPGSPARETFRELLVEAARLRTAILAVTGARSRLQELGAADLAGTTTTFLAEAGVVLTTVGDAIAAGRDLPEISLDPPADGPPRAPETDAIWWFAHGRMLAIAGQLRAAARMTVPRDRHHTRGRPTPPDELRAALGTLRANLDPASATFRHAARLAVALPVGAALARGLSSSRGYWIPLTVLVVLKPDFATTISRGIARIAGTTAGVALASVVAAEFDPRGDWVIAVVGALAYLGFVVFAANYAAYAAAVGALVVFLVAVVDPQPTHVALDRAADTLVGGALAFVAFLAWPAWAGTELRPALTRLLTAIGAYLGAALGAVVDPAGADRPELRRRADAARRARSNAETVLARVDGEPRSRRGDPETARAVVAAAARLVRTGHELSALAPADAPPLDAVRRFRRDVTTSMDALAAAVATDAAAGGPDLRAAYGPVGARLREPCGDRDEDARRLVIAGDLDAIVDSVDLARDVLTARTAESEAHP